MCGESFYQLLILHIGDLQNDVKRVSRCCVSILVPFASALEFYL